MEGTTNGHLFWNQGFYCNSSNQAKRLVLRRGLQMAIFLGIKNLDINYDSKVLVRSMHNFNISTNLVAIIYECR